MPASATGAKKALEVPFEKTDSGKMFGTAFVGMLVAGILSYKCFTERPQSSSWGVGYAILALICIGTMIYCWSEYKSR